VAYLREQSRTLLPGIIATTLWIAVVAGLLHFGVRLLPPSSSMPKTKLPLTITPGLCKRLIAAL
jgi:hypothetical protein